MNAIRTLALMGTLALLSACGGGEDSPGGGPGVCTVSDTPTAANRVIFRITSLPANHPEGDVPYLAGTMNGWSPGNSAWALSPNCDGSWQVEVPFGQAGDIHQFKFTRGSWAKVEVDAEVYDLPNRLLNWDGEQKLATFSVARWADLEGGSKGKAPTLTGNVVFEDVAMGDSTRRLRIYLPPDYATSGARRYPVLYMFDGQNLYDERTAGFGQEWKVDETLQQQFAAGESDGVIVVGIDNAGDAVKRYEEYTAWDWTHPTLGAISARGDEVASWMVNSVLPYINGKYRTLTDRAHTGLAGSSMGGYMTLYTGTTYPAVFGRLASFSTVALDDPMQGQQLRDWVSAAASDEGRAPWIASTWVYMDMGDQEVLSYTTKALLVENHQQMCAAFGGAGYSPDCQLIVGGVHDEGAWSKRFPAVVKAMFPKSAG